MTIQIYDHGYLIDIEFEDIRKLHGIRAYMAIGVGYRVIEAALKELGGDSIFDREDIQVISGHGGPGFGDAIEFITRAKTRGVYTIDTNYPEAQYDPYRPTGYVFIFTHKHNKTVQVTLNKDFLPTKFYEYLKKGREDSLTPEEYEDNEQLKKELCFKALLMPQEQLLTVKQIPTPKIHV